MDCPDWKPSFSASFPDRRRSVARSMPRPTPVGGFANKSANCFPRINAIFYAPTQSAARAAFFTLKQQWGRLFPSAVQIIEKDLDSLLTFFQFDPTYWTVLRTTNPIERLNKEFKRRTNAMEVTGGEISTYRCLAYVAQTMEYRWSFHPLSQWSTVYTLNAA